MFLYLSSMDEERFMPITYANAHVNEVPAVYIIHENADWTGPLFAALDVIGVAYQDWNLANVNIDLSKNAPAGVFLWLISGNVLTCVTSGSMTFVMKP